MMNTLSIDTVLDELLAELTHQRRCEAAYVALARVILADDRAELEERDASAA